MSPITDSRRKLNGMSNMVVQRDYAPDYASIPPHGRWQHFNVGGRDRIENLLASWPSTIDPSERCRRLLDLFLVSVLLDAGAGTSWSYKSRENGRTYRRSEGLAIASLEMFKAGTFSSNSSQPHQVDGEGLRTLTVEIMSAGLQVSESNPLAGLEGRANLLIRLSGALNNQQLFGADARPGNMLGVYLWRCPSFSLANIHRLPHLPSSHSRLIRPHCPPSDALVSPNRRPRRHLACLTHRDRRNLPRRRLAPFYTPRHRRYPTLGNHCPLPQALPMALLLPHAAYEQTHEHPFRRCRTYDWAP